MINVAILGATGYTGLELLRLLVRHPEARLAALTSEKFAGQRLTEVFPAFLNLFDATLEKASASLGKKTQLVFSCLPHRASMQKVVPLLEKGLKVIDLSADFRFRDAATYAQWYEPHAHPEWLAQAVYGLPELHRAQLKKATLVGNPGCYTTASILGLAPLLKAGWIEPEGIICDTKSGVSGAGRGAILESMFSEVNESVHAYKIGTHRHAPEIEQELSGVAGKAVKILFVPHLIPMDRGILATLYARPLKPRKPEALTELYRDFFKKEPFVRVYPAGRFPKTKDVRGTNFCDIGATYDAPSGRIVVISALDNLVKGAAGQAVHNMNLMFGLPETTGLTQIPLLP